MKRWQLLVATILTVGAVSLFVLLSNTAPENLAFITASFTSKTHR